MVVKYQVEMTLTIDHGHQAQATKFYITMKIIYHKNEQSLNVMVNLVKFLLVKFTDQASHKVCHHYCDLQLCIEGYG